MEQTALEWRAEIELYSAIKMAAVFFDIGEFGGNLTPQEVKTRPVTANGGLFARIGVPYLCPPARYFGARRGVRRGVRRAAHMVGAAFRLAVGAADAALTSAVVGWRRRRTRGLAWLAIGLSALAAQADDYGNTWRTAQPIAATNIPVAGVIENDYDEDWFCFEGLPETDYVIQLATNTIWDGTLEMLTPFAAAKLAETGTAYGASPASGRWTNAGVRAVFYLRVTPFLEFTTGSYQLVVFPTNAVDSDHDGLLDSWEMRNFNTLTNNGFGDWDGDTFNNADEYHMRTEPTNAASGLFISGWGADSGTNWLAWPAGLYGTYQVAAHTNMRGAAHWIVLTDVYAAATAVITNLPPEPRNRPVRCYRLQFVP